MESNIVKFESQFNEIATSVGDIKKGEEIKQSYQPFLNELFSLQQATSKIDFKNPSEIDEKLAKDIRLKIVKIRTGSETLKKQRKEVYSLMANVEQSAWNLIKSTCELAENQLYNVEKAKEIKEKARLQELFTLRTKECINLGIDYSFVNLNMPDAQYNDILNGLKLAKAQREQDELNRIEKERLEKIENERIRLENERLKKEAIEKELIEKENQRKQAEILRLEREKLEKEKQAEAKRQAEILAKQKAESDRIAKIEAEKQAKIQAELKAKAEAERLEREKLEAEIKAKKDVELKKEAERLAEIERLKKAGESEQLKAWLKEFKSPEVIEFDKAKEVLAKFNSFKQWATKLIEN